MARSIRRQLRFLHGYVATTLLIFVVLAVSAFTQPAKPQNIGEITAERINIVDANGTLRLVISNKDRMHPGVIGGKVVDRPRPYAGLLFFNDQGDEAGGLILTGREQNSTRAANAGLMFDPSPARLRRQDPRSRSQRDAVRRAGAAPARAQGERGRQREHRVPGRGGQGRTEGSAGRVAFVIRHLNQQDELPGQKAQR